MLAFVAAVFWLKLETIDRALRRQTMATLSALLTGGF
jgi:hypothetical protein